MLGVLGGTFDPIHFGHLRTALDVVEALGLDELRFLPAARPPHRGAPRVDAERRLAMVALAIADEPRFALDRREIDREGPSYMVDTLASIRAEIAADAPLILVVGADAFAGLDRWSRWTQLFEHAHLVVMTRPDAPPVSASLTAAIAPRLAAAAHALRAEPAGRVWFQTVTALTISASDLRARLRAGRSVRYLMPDAVIDYLARDGLYR